MTTDAQCAAWKHVKLINANDFSSVPKFFHVKMEVLLASTYTQKGWMVWNYQLNAPFHNQVSLLPF